jgi:hypothetical protein
MDNLIFAYGGPNPKETWEQQQNEKRCDITDLECWQHGGHAVDRRESESGPVYGFWLLWMSRYVVGISI